jgi:ABC-2 type transport system permease protein
MELRLAARRGENVLVTLVIPVAVLLFFGGTSLGGIGGGTQRGIVAGSIALAIIAAGLVNLGIATAYERHYGVLKRFGGAPVPRWGFVAAKAAAVVVLQVVQLILIVGAATIAFRWSPGPAWSPVLFAIAFVLGTATFVSLGLLLAGGMRAEAVLGLANLLFLLFLTLGGVIVPVDGLPGILQPLVTVLPATALSDLMRIALDSDAAGAAGGVGTALVTLLAWGIGATAAVSRTFRWD